MCPRARRSSRSSSTRSAPSSRFDDLGGGRTRIVESGVGYGEGPGFDDLYRHFSAGNAEEFSDLAKYLASGPVDWKTELAPVTASVKK